MDGDKPEAGLYRPRFHHGTEPCSLYSLADWDNGLAFKNINFSELGLPVVKIAEIKAGIGPDTKFTDGQYNERALIADGDLLFCWSGQPETSIGTFRWWQGPAWLNQHVFKVTPKGDLSADYLRHLLRYLQPQFVQIASNKQTTGLGHVTKADLRDMLVEVPSPALQDRIADALNPIDDKIELNRRMAATLEEMARALFKSWFVDFDPVRAKAEGRDPGLPAATAALFPDTFGEDGLPMGWTKASLLDHARLISGGTPKTEEPSYWGGSILWASAKDVSQCADRFLTTTERTITPRGLEESATRMVPALSTVVVARGATTGRHCLFGRDMAMNQTCYALHSEAHRPFWLACTFSALVDELVHGAHGSVFDTITTTTLKTAKIIHAGGEIVSAFERTIQPIYERILSLVDDAATLRTLRDTLLPKLISGELRIKDANGAVEAA